MQTSQQLSTVGELRKRLEQLANDGVPDEATIVIHRSGFDDIAAIAYRVQEDFQPAEHQDAGLAEPPGYWTVVITLDVAASVPYSKLEDEFSSENHWSCI